MIKGQNVENCPRYLVSFNSYPKKYLGNILLGKVLFSVVFLQKSYKLNTWFNSSSATERGLECDDSGVSSGCIHN